MKSKRKKVKASSQKKVRKSSINKRSMDSLNIESHRQKTNTGSQRSPSGSFLAALGSKEKKPSVKYIVDNSSKHKLGSSSSTGNLHHTQHVRPKSHMVTLVQPEPVDDHTKMLKVRENLRSLNNYISKTRDKSTHEEKKPKQSKKKSESGKKRKKTKSITHDDLDDEGNRMYNLPMQMVPKKKKKRKSPKKVKAETRVITEEERKVMEEFGGDQGELYNEYLRLLSEVKEQNLR